DPRRTWLFDHVRDLVRVTGYFKFVHPERVGGKPRMDFEAYKAIFNGSFGFGPGLTEYNPGFTQYYAHEHLDRPEVRPPRTPPAFESRITGGRFIYDYLQRDLDIAAGE